MNKVENNSNFKSLLKDQFSFNTVQVASMGLLIALEVVLNRFGSINMWNLKIGLAFIPVVIAGMLFGPVKASLVGVLSDIIGAILFPSGAFFPGFTLTAFLKGLLYGTLLYKNPKFLNVTLAVVIDQFILSLLLNSLWISILYASSAAETGYWAVVASRVVQVAIIVPVEFAVCMALPKVLINRLKPMLNSIGRKKSTLA